MDRGERTEREETTCPLIRISVFQADGEQAQEPSPYFYLARIEPGTALTVFTEPEMPVTALYLPPGFRQAGSQLFSPAWLPPAPVLLICSVGRAGCAIPVLIYGSSV